MQKFSAIQNLKQKMKERFASFEKSNDSIIQAEFKLTEDVYRQIIETKKLSEYLTCKNDKISKDKKDKKDKKEVNTKSEISNYELVNFMNKLEKEGHCFTFSNSHNFKQVTRIHKWLIMEENYMRNFALKSYEVSSNMAVEKAEFITECDLISQLFCEDLL